VRLEVFDEHLPAIVGEDVVDLPDDPADRGRTVFGSGPPGEHLGLAGGHTSQQSAAGGPVLDVEEFVAAAQWGPTNSSARRSRALTSVRRTSWSQLLLAGAAAVTAGLLAVVTPPVGSAWAGHLAGGQALSGSDPGETATAEVGLAPGRVPRRVRPGSLLRPRAFPGRGERRDPGRPDLDDPT